MVSRGGALPGPAGCGIFRRKSVIHTLFRPVSKAPMHLSAPSTDSSPRSGDPVTAVPGEGAPAIEVDGFCKSYGGRVAVDALSFAVRGGEIAGLVGPNGAGKTTTLRAIAGIHPPGGGRIRIAGHDVVRDARAAKRRLALVPDEPHLFNSLTVWEHLELSARLYGVAEWARPAAALLEELE